MRNLILANNDIGLYRFRKELIEDLCSNHKVYIALPDGDFIDELKNMGCEFIPFEFDRRGVNPIEDLKQIAAYIGLIKQIRPDIVLTYTIKPNAYGGLACRLTKTPYIANVTGLGTSIENGGLLGFISTSLYRIGLRKANCVFFQNSANRELFLNKKIVRGKTRVIPGSGVNLNTHCFEEYPPEESAPHLIFVGRIMRDKGINELLEAAKAVKRNHPEVQFDLIGSFDESLQSAVEEAVKAGSVNYLGSQSDMHRFYKDCWAVVMPSYHEGTCNVCLEGASTGRPLIASNVPGCRETFDERVSGIGFEAKSASALTEAIEKFLALPYEEKAVMGLAGRKKMEREYDRSIVINAYLEEINNISR